MARQTRHAPTNHTVLVVDDQEEVLHSVRELLSREGHRVLTAESGARALELLKENDVHLLLVDYFMPRMSGEQLIRQIRTFDPYVQIILQTGYSGDKPGNRMMAELDIQGYHDKADGPEKLLLWVAVGLKAHRLIAKLRERERLQGELVANVSHEFRTPLHIIGGYCELLLQGEFGGLPDNAGGRIERIAEAASNLSELVSDLLKYAKMEAGLRDTAPRPMVVRELTEEMSRLAGLLLESSEVQFCLDETALPARFVSDPVMLRTILRNLIANAVKFTSEGEIRLQITRHDGTLRFAVSDSGIGIPTEAQQAIFEPFRQLDGSMSRKHRGIGLGLALSRKFARLLGGDLWVESQAGVGSTFTLEIPAVEAIEEIAEMAPVVDGARVIYDTASAA